VADPAALALSPEPDHINALRRLGLTSAVCIAMVYRGAVVGAMTFARMSGIFRPVHVALLRTLANRVGQTVANGRAFEEIQNTGRRKDEFLAMLGHELRNPLGAITNAVALLQTGKLSRDDEAPIRAIISRQLRHLTKLVNDLVDVARLSKGKIPLRRVPVDLLTVAEQCVATIRGAGKGTDHDISIQGTPLVVVGDPVRLEQVLDNLVDNSVKHTPPGGAIRIGVEARGREAVLTVRDTGDGVSAELLPRMFELFTQGSQGLDRQAGGLGVGLAIVKAIVELHEGSVQAHSPGPGAGTEVSVRLPLAPAQNIPPPTEEAPSRPNRHYRILVVEDNADARETLRLLLELEGHRVELASDGQIGLEMAIRTHPDVALIDLGLPGLNGYDLARRLRAAPGGTDIRLIAVTGYSQPQDRRRASEAGFESFLVKPVNRRALEGAIHSS
jgi:signal transduction histidine kinase/CheY-like chemotaxis protein